ncbi:MAG: inositol monophosphatase family protein [Chloroflexota bacterium]
MKPTLEDLSAMARGAGEILRAGFNQKHQVALKGEIDLVTEVDQLSEDFLLNEIKQRFPDHKIITEESGVVENHPEHTWYLDPLDGTTNFAHGLPIFSVSIGYAYQGEVELGVVYDPIREELFSAELGKGAWLNEKPIRAGNQSELKNSLLITGLPYDRFTNPDNNLENFTRFALQVRGLRRLGSAALDLCFVAAGRVDGYWEVRLEPWDLAAGKLIVEQAGGVVTRRDGSDDLLTPPCSVVAANPALHREMVAVLQQDQSAKQ